MHTLPRHFNAGVCLLILFVLALGCGKRSNPRTASSGKSSGPVRATHHSDPQLAVDHSLKAEDYIRLGLPAPDRVWSGADMIQANTALASFTQEKAAQLPRYKSPRSGEVFARLTSIESLPSFRDPDVPVQTRVRQARDYFYGFKEILEKYSIAFLDQRVRDAELVELWGALLRIFIVQLEIVDEPATLDKQDPKYAVQLQAQELVRLGLGEFVNALLTSFTERDQYSDAALGRLLGHMQETLPVIAPRLLPPGRTEAVSRLQQLLEDPELKDLHPGLRELLGSVEDALEKPKLHGPAAAPNTTSMLWHWCFGPS